MSIIQKNLKKIHERINQAEQQSGKTLNSTQLVVVSKQQPIEKIEEALRSGQKVFGENYVQEALPKIEALSSHLLTWHFIGHIQRNKTKLIAEHFDWVQSVDNLLIAQRLNDQRPEKLEPLNVCIQVNVENELQKSGVVSEAVFALAEAITKMSRLKLRGLMAIPAIGSKIAFQQLKNIFEELKNKNFELDVLSMGMSDDFELAIKEGATMVRLGTAVFGG